jgi:hypothetical protein
MFLKQLVRINRFSTSDSEDTTFGKNFHEVLQWSTCLTLLIMDEKEPRLENKSIWYYRPYSLRYAKCIWQETVFSLWRTGCVETFPTTFDFCLLEWRTFLELYLSKLPSLKMSHWHPYLASKRWTANSRNTKYHHFPAVTGMDSNQ